MAPARTRFYVVAGLTLLIGGFVVASLMQPMFGTREDFSMYNTRWNGASDLAGDVYGTGSLVPAFSLATGDEEATLAHRSFASYDLDPLEHTVLSLGPSKDVTEREAAWLASFVEEGGRLVVADNFGSGNRFLEASGAETRIDGELVADLAYSKQPPFVVVTDITDHPATGGAGEVLLDHGSVLSPGENATVLMRTGASAWLDANLNMVQDPGEASGPFALMAVEPVGNGTVLAVSDPSVYINGMRDQADNERFSMGLVAWMNEGDRAVLIDEAHRAYPDPVRFLGVTMGEMSDRAAWGLGFFAFGLFLLFAVGRPEAWARKANARLQDLIGRVFPQEEPERHDPVEIVAKRHPGWNKSTLEEVRVTWEGHDAGSKDRG